MQDLADSLKTDRHQILACIKYEVLGKRSVYDSFKILCEIIGDDALHIVSPPQSSPIPTSTTHVPADSLKTDRRQVLACIKYEVLSKRPVYDSFKTFCERIGDDVMGYQELEFWYWRFYNGEMDMDYDRNKDPKPLELFQLPVEIVGKIVEKLDLPSRLTTRNVCKPLGTIVDGCKMKIKSVNVSEVSVEAVLLDFGCNQRIAYFTNTDKRGIMILYGEQTFQKKRVNLVDFALNDLKTMMKGHNLELDYLAIRNNRQHLDLVEKALNCLKEISTFSKTQFKVKGFQLSSFNNELLVQFLTLLKPGVLEWISVNHISEEISNTEQWRQAKIGHFFDWNRGVNPAEIKRFLHFEEFHVNVNSMSAESMVQLREMLLTSPSFKKCKITIASKPRFTIHMASTALMLPIQDREIHVPIPDSTDVLVITVSGIYVEIERRFL